MAREAIKDYEEEAALAVAEEEKAKAQPDEGVYVHKFKKPFTHANHAVEELTFDWESLTGKDYDEIKRNAQANSGFKGTFSQAQADISANQKQAAAIGISITDANGQMLPLLDMTGMLRERFSGMSEAE